MIRTTAAQLVEQFIEDGTYFEKNYVETQLKKDKQTLQTILQASDIKRHEYQKMNMVAKFIPKKIYGWDEKGMIEYLMDYLVPEVYLDCLAIDQKQLASSIKDWDEISKPFKQKPAYYIKLNFNKTGKQLIKVNTKKPNKNEWELLDDIKQLLLKQRPLENHFNVLKGQLLQSKQLYVKRNLPHKYGSISLLENKSTYDLHHLLDVFGETFFLEYGHVHKQQLMELVKKGFIKKQVLESFRTLKDIRLDFVVTTLDAEQRMLNGMKRNG